MPTININLTAEMVEFVEAQIASGDYVSASEVVRDALRVLRHDRQSERQKLAVLKDEIACGLQDAQAGRFSSRLVTKIAYSVLDEDGN